MSSKDLTVLFGLAVAYAPHRSDRRRISGEPSGGRSSLIMMPCAFPSPIWTLDVARSRSNDQRYYGVYEAIVSDVNDPGQKAEITHCPYRKLDPTGT